MAARFVSRLSHFACNCRAAAPFVNVRRIPTIDRAVASHLSRYELNLWAARQTRFYVISNISLAVAPYLANSSPTPSGGVRRILLFHFITSSCRLPSALARKSLLSVTRYSYTQGDVCHPAFARFALTPLHVFGRWRVWRVPLGTRHGTLLPGVLHRYSS